LLRVVPARDTKDTGDYSPAHARGTKRMQSWNGRIRVQYLPAGTVQGNLLAETKTIPDTEEFSGVFVRHFFENSVSIAFRLGAKFEW
jgi:hypothetical protein